MLTSSRACEANHALNNWALFDISLELLQQDYSYEGHNMSQSDISNKRYVLNFILILTLSVCLKWEKNNTLQASPCRIRKCHPQDWNFNQGFWKPRL